MRKSPRRFAYLNHSWGRRLNENTNDLLYQYWPKSIDLKQVTNVEVQRKVVSILSRRPRTIGFNALAQLKLRSQFINIQEFFCV